MSESKTGKPTEEELNKIAEMMLTKSYNSYQIAEAISRTRNSVMGIIWRTPRLKEIGLPPAPPIGKKPKPTPVPAPVITERKPEMNGHVLMTELKDSHCRFPMWGHHEIVGADGLFCAAARLPDSVYCDKHHKLCVSQYYPKPIKKVKEIA